jgi:ribonuclease-3
MIDKIFGYKFKNSKLLELALTHPSITVDKGSNYQKLEFLGDRIIAMVMSEYIYQNFASEDEGTMSRRLVSLVCGERLAEIAKENKIGGFLLLSKGEEKNNGRNNSTNLEDAMEALIAAIFLDSDYQNVKNILLRLWDKKLNLFNSNNYYYDPKSQLQEYMQANNMALPEYKLLAQAGTDHEPIFTMMLEIKDIVITVEASSKKKGERMLAELMLNKLLK